MDIITSSTILRTIIQERVSARKLTYSQIVDMAKSDGISIAKSNLAAYFNGKSKGCITQSALTYLALKLGIDLKLSINASDTEEVRRMTELKLNALLNKTGSNERTNPKGNATPQEGKK